MFRALLAHHQQVLYVQQLVCFVRISQLAAIRAGVELVSHQFHSSPGSSQPT
jgi:hypothetical protein